MRLAYAIASLIAVTTLAAQPKVQAFVSDTRIVEGQSFTLEIKCEGGEIRSVSQENLADFRILSGPATSRSVQIINGVVSATSSVSWTLIPKQKGKQVVPGLDVRVNGSVVHTNPVNIEVVAAASVDGQSQAQDRSYYLIAQVDKQKPYRGEQVTVEWTLYVTQPIAGMTIEELPSLTGFWVEELFIPDRLSYRERIINGRRYFVAVVRRVALFPTQSGEHVIDPLVLKIAVQVRDRRRVDPFFDDLSIFNRGRVDQHVLASSAVSVHVIPTPHDNRPPDYEGLVGRYTLAGVLSSADVQQDEAVTLTLTINGEGNFKALDAPNIEFPPGLEVFDPKISGEPSLGDIVGGSKSIEYVIIPRRVGSFTIPSVRLPYFNPAQKRYTIGTVGPFLLNVRPREDALAASPGYSRHEVALLGKDIRFMKSGRPRWLRTGQGWYTPGLLLLNLATVLIFAAPALGARFLSLATILGPSLKARRALNTAVSMIDAAEGEPEQVYGEFSRAVTQYLNHKLGRDTREYTMAMMTEILTAKGIDQTCQDSLITILERAAAARFGPVRGGDVEAGREALKQVLGRVEAEWSG